MVLFWYWPVKSGLIGRKQFGNSKKMRTAVRALTKNIIDKHFETYEEGVSRDFIDIYISQIKQSEPGSSFHSEEGSKAAIKYFCKSESIRKIIIICDACQL
jgi:hypothetical protein